MESPGPAPNLSVWFIAKTACVPVSKILLLCWVGAVLANPRVNVLPPHAIKSLNKLVYAVFTPALVFYNLGSGLTFSYILQWWYMPVNVLMNSALGALLGWGVAVLTRPREDLFRLTISCCTMGNMGNLPLVLMSTLCADPKNPFGGTKVCLEKGIAYQSYAMWMAVVVMWMFVYNFLRPPTGGWKVLASAPNKVTEGSFLAEPSGKPLANGTPAGKELPLLSPVKDRRQLDGREVAADEELALLGLVEEATDVSAASPKEEGCLAWCQQNVRWRDMCTPPVIAVALALLIGGSPLKGLLFGPDAPLKLVSDTTNILGQAMIPCMMIVLGANLSEGPVASNMSMQTILGVMSVRLIVLPLLGVMLVKLADAAGFLPPNDPLFRFTILLQFATPTAINIGTVATMHGVGEKEASAVLFWSYLVSVVTMTAYIMLFIWVVL